MAELGTGDGGHIATVDVAPLVEYVDARAPSAAEPCGASGSATDTRDAPRAVVDVACKLAEQLRTRGFVALVGHGVDSATMDAAFRAARRFFTQPHEAKRRAQSVDRARRGYSAAGTENFASLIADRGRPNDLVEKFRIGPPLSDALRAEDAGYYAGTKQGRAAFFPNTWPGAPGDTGEDTEDAAFRAAVEAYYNSMEALAAALLLAFEVALGLPQGFLRSRSARHTSILALNHYPALQPRDVRPGQLRIAAHHDVDMFTLVAQTAGLGGLEIFAPETEAWVPVPFIDGAIICNVGDALSEWSRGRLSSTLHRVALPPLGVPGVSDEEATRYSLAFFFAPDHDAPLDEMPLDGVDSDEEGAADAAAVAGGAGACADGRSCALTYAAWRKAHVKKSMAALKPRGQHK